MTPYEMQHIKLLSSLITLSTLMKNAEATGKVNTKQLLKACQNYLNNQSNIVLHVKELESALSRDLDNTEVK